ncbi:MAG: hypothetical protein ONB25_05715 [candidate division KSB1 bacterium]|nr:hypothetical protein [candidate division KSB1 bacterium]MDZ7414029.1 hypothetical protein [candidate division KSB1 bacterium]
MKGSQWLLVDAGGFNAGAGTLNKFKAEFLLKGLAKMGYHAINVSQRDLAHGAQPLLEWAKKEEIPLLSANAYGEKGNLLFPPSRIVELPGQGSKRSIRVGIIGVSPPYEMTWQPPPGMVKPTFRDPVPEVQRVLADLRKKCDLVVVLAFMTWAEAHELVEKAGAPHVVVVGNSGYQNQKPSLESGVLYLPGGRQGKLARLVKVRAGDQGVIAFNPTEQLLDDSYPDDPDMVAILNEHQKRLEEWRASLMQNTEARPR